MKSPKGAHSRFTRLLCLLLALHFLNFSIDPRDAAPDNIPEDLTINDIESVSEFVAEVVFECPDAFGEHDERDSEEGGSFDFNKAYKLYCSASISSISFRAYLPTTSTLKFLHENDQLVLSLSREVSSPPPRA